MYPKPTNLPRYFYRLVSTGEPDDIESDYEQLITGEHVVSNDLWQLMRPLVEDQCMIRKRPKEDRYLLEPQTQVSCINAVKKPKQGEEVFRFHEIESSVHICRVKELPTVILISPELFARLRGTGLTGIGVIEVDDETFGPPLPSLRFLRWLETNKDYDPVVKAILERCRRINEKLLDITIRDPSYLLEGATFECTWFLTNVGPQGIVKCRDRFVFVGENGNTLESMPFSSV
jgi:hypothetical protein